MNSDFVPNAMKKYYPLVLAFLVLFIYFIYLYFVFIQISEQSIMEWIYAIIGTFSVIMLFWALYQASKIDPGFIPRNTLVEYDETKPKVYCLTCRIKRPERSHHCSKCQRCILHMDHHCIWTDNCIGFYNRKFFILILFWGSIGMLQATFVGLTNIQTLWIQIWQYDSLDLNKVGKGLLFLMVFSQFFNSFGLYYFFWMNFKLIMTNISTLDQLILDIETYNKRKYDGDLTIYNLGFWYNFQFYFGKNPYLWFIPIGKPLGDGYNWDKKVSSREMSDTGLQMLE